MSWITTRGLVVGCEKVGGVAANSGRILTEVADSINAPGKAIALCVLDGLEIVTADPCLGGNGLQSDLLAAPQGGEVR